MSEVTLLQWPLWLLGCFGFAYICGHSTISLRIRTIIGGLPMRMPTDIEPGQAALPGLFGRPGAWLIALVECPACFGFWTGFVQAVAGAFPVAGQPLSMSHLAACVWIGCVVSGSNFILGRATRLI